MKRSEYGFHIEHCCKIHGCKYGDKDCPVVKGVVKQAYLCEYCNEDLQDEDYYKCMLERVDQVKVLKKELEHETTN